MKPNPATWIKTAAVSWLKHNDASDLPNQNVQAQQYGVANAREIVNAEKQGEMIEAIRNEHNRVYIQDQRLLASINQSIKGQDPASLTRRLAHEVNLEEL